MYNILIYFCNIPIKHLKHLKHSLQHVFFVLLPYNAAQAMDGQAEGNAVVAPSGGERRGRWGQAAGEL
jgi:hypothetical protein